jgi:hypothetical protein
MSEIIKKQREIEKKEMSGKERKIKICTVQ